MTRPTDELSALWWPRTRAAKEPQYKPQRGKPSPATVARRKRRNAAVVQVWSRLPTKGEPRRQMWEQLIDGEVAAEPQLLADIEAALSEFGDGFKVSGRHAERIAKG